VLETFVVSPDKKLGQAVQMRLHYSSGRRKEAFVVRGSRFFLNQI